MPLILIYGDCFTGRRALAEYLSARLGYRLITPCAVVQQAELWGVPEAHLLRILKDPPLVLDPLANTARSDLAVLRAAAADKIGNGNFVCYGRLADLLVRENLPAIRIRTFASPQTRMGIASRILKLNPSVSAVFLVDAERVRKCWLKLVSEFGGPEVMPDLLVNSDQIDVEQVFQMVVGQVKDEGKFNCAAIRLDDFWISSKIQAALAADPATEHLNVTVKSNSGSLSICGLVPHPRDLVQIQRVAGRFTEGGAHIQ